MRQFVSIHTIPGYTSETLEESTGRPGRSVNYRHANGHFCFGAAKVVRDWRATDKNSLSRTNAVRAVPCDQMMAMHEICERGEQGVDIRHVWVR